jgi:hypothetical protein
MPGPTDTRILTAPFRRGRPTEGTDVWRFGYSQQSGNDNPSYALGGPAQNAVSRGSGMVLATAAFRLDRTIAQALWPPFS